MFRVALGIVAVAAYIGLLWYLGARRERNAKREAAANGVSFSAAARYNQYAAGTFCTRCGARLADGECHLMGVSWTCDWPAVRPVSFSRPAAKGFKRPGNGAVA